MSRLGVRGEGSPLLGSSAPCYYSPLPGTGVDNIDKRTHTPRLRSNSVAVCTEEEDVVFTSYGPVVLQEETSPRTSSRWLLGWLLAILSGILFTANNFLVKYYTIEAVDMLLVRSGLQTVLMAFIILVTKRSFLPTARLDKVLVLLQGLIGGLRILLQFACVLFMPLGDALTIVFTEPLWTVLLSRLVLSIRIGAWKIIFGCLLLCGMVLCVQPPFLFPHHHHHHHHPHPHHHNSTHNMTHIGFIATFVDIFIRRKKAVLDEETDEETDYYIGVVLALGTAVTGAMANVCIARCERVSSKVLVFWAGLGGVLIAFICTGFDEEAKIMFNISDIEDFTWPLLMVLGLMGLLGHFSLTRALRLIPPTTVAVLRAMEIVLAYIVQALVMKEIPNSLSITGSGLVMISVVAFALEQILCDCFDLVNFVGPNGWI